MGPKAGVPDTHKLQSTVEDHTTNVRNLPNIEFWVLHVLFLSPCLGLFSSKKEVEETPTTKCNGWIDRNHFSDPAKLIVRVQAKNQHGSAISTEVVYNTTDISKEEISYHSNMMPLLSGNF